MGERFSFWGQNLGPNLGQNPDCSRGARFFLGQILAPNLGSKSGSNPDGSGEVRFFLGQHRQGQFLVAERLAEDTPRARF